MSDLVLFRQYAPDELGADGYPPEWHQSIKHLVREQAGHRCVRCHHPYRNGEHGTGEWTPCDVRCTHDGPFGVRRGNFGIVVSHNDVDLDTYEQVLAVCDGMRVVGDTHTVLARWRILTVHHLDGDKANCQWWNLAALCQRCHLTIQGRVLMARVWPWEHSEWFRPYVAGYYASVYLGETLTRAQVDARLDELLALERAA